MLLITAGALSGLAVLLFGLGLATGRYELAMFGAVIMVGAGASAVVDGVQVKDGEVSYNRTNTVPLDDISGSGHVLDRPYTEGSAPSGASFSGDGSRLYVSERDGGVVRSFGLSPWAVGAARERRSLDVSQNDAAPTGVDVAGGGSVLAVSGDDTDSLYVYRMADSHNLTNATLSSQLDVGDKAGSPSAVELEAGGDRLYVADSAEAEVEQYELAEPYNVSTATHLASLSVSAQTGAPTGLAFGGSGSVMLVSGDAGSVHRYGLATAYSVASAGYSGSSLALDTGSEPEGVEYERGRELVVVPESNYSRLTVYESTGAETVSVSEQTYSDVETHTGFPLGLVLVLLGAVMLMGGAGEASEEGRSEPPWRR
jgi:propanediol dehydratase small subunit